MLPQLVEEHAHRPRVGDDVVHDQQQEVILRAQAQQCRTQERVAGQIERPLRLGSAPGGAPRPRASGSPLRSTTASSTARVAADHLDRLAVHLDERGPQHLVASHDRLQAVRSAASDSVPRSRSMRPML